MPRVPAFKIDAIAALFQQLRYAPAATRRRELRAIEALVADIDPDGVYPEDFVVFRITGYRPEHGDGAVRFAGAALLGELTSFVQRLSRDLDLPPAYDDRVALPLADVAERLSISRKTIQRYRRRGLVCHYVTFEDGISRLACFEDALERFIAADRGRMERARTFTRLTDDDRAGVIEAARVLREAERLTLHEAAARLAPDLGRATETIRQLLQRHDRFAETPIFDGHGPLSRHDVELCWRARRFGVPVSALRRRFGKSAPTIHRAINRHRAELLRGLDLAYVTLPTFDLADAETIILGAGAVVRGLDAGRPAHGDTLALVAELREAASHDHAADVDEATEDTLVAALNYLERRADEAIRTLPGWPSAAAVDAVETDLRWAAALRRRLVTLGLPAAVRVAEQTLGRPLPEQPSETIRVMLRLAAEVVSETIDTLDPSRGHRLARRAALAMDRALAARGVRGDGGGRAAARHEAGSIPLDGLLDGLAPGMAFLDLPATRRARLDGLDGDARRLVVARYGLDGTPPRTLAQLAEIEGVTPAAVARRLATAERALRRAPDSA